MAIVKNAIRCLKCKDVIVSERPHLEVYCSCGLVAVDGGELLIRRIGRLGVDYEELLERNSELAPEIYVDYTDQETKRAQKEARRMAEAGGAPEAQLAMMTEMARMREKIESLEQAAATRDADADADGKADDSAKDAQSSDYDAKPDAEPDAKPDAKPAKATKPRGERADVSRLGS